MNNPLTLLQQQRLINASSKMTREEWGKLPVGITDQIAARIDRVIQWIEILPSKQKVGGSSPSAIAKSALW